MAVVSTSRHSAGKRRVDLESEDLVLRAKLCCFLVPCKTYGALFSFSIK